MFKQFIVVTQIVYSYKFRYMNDLVVGFVQPPKRGMDAELVAVLDKRFAHGLFKLGCKAGLAHSAHPANLLQIDLLVASIAFQAYWRMV